MVKKHSIDTSDSSQPWNNMFAGSVGYLLNQARITYFANIEQQLAPLNITSAQFMVVVGIAHKRARTLTEFCQLFGYDTGAMKRLLDRIEDKGIIRRTRSEEDRRTVYLELTEAGLALYPGILSAVTTVSGGVLDGFSEEEALQFQRFLQRAIANGQR